MVVVGDDLDLAPVDAALALISSAASCAAFGMEEPATAWASAITPILIGVSSAQADGAMANIKAVEAARARHAGRLSAPRRFRGAIFYPP